MPSIGSKYRAEEHGLQDELVILQRMKMNFQVGE